MINVSLQHKELEEKILNGFWAITERPMFLNLEEWQRGMIRTFLQSSKLEIGVKLIVANRDYDCENLYHLSETVLCRLTQQEIPSNFPEIAYQYIIGNIFPKARTMEIAEALEPGILFYLELCKVVGSLEKQGGASGQFITQYPMMFLTEQEAQALEDKKEYITFKQAWEDQYIYEMMKLSQETSPHNTLDHICGVYFIAMYIARQLKRVGLPVDLGRVCGAAAGHDIGKFGCSGTELSRVPYLHYYYTDVWFHQNGLPFMGNVAVNHSTWDLELETLPLESLVLIYSDFRVKNQVVNGDVQMHIFSLTDSFNVILSKLDNVDQAKENRYRRVYAKLKDFEDFMVSMGIDTTLSKEQHLLPAKPPMALVFGNEIVEQMKYIAITKNTFLMNQMSREESFNIVLDGAASENDWIKLRGYLNIFEEYYSYLTQDQKLITLAFLYNLLIHKEEDIRNQSAELMGRMIAHFDEEYRKEVPPTVELEKPAMSSKTLFAKYLDLFLYPDHKMLETHVEWVGLNLKIFVGAVFHRCTEKQGREFIEVLLPEFARANGRTDNVMLFLIQTLKHIPFHQYRDIEMQEALDFIAFGYSSQDPDIHTSSLKTIYVLIRELAPDDPNRAKLIDIIVRQDEESPEETTNYLKYKLLRELEMDETLLQKYEKYTKFTEFDLAGIYLTNLKNATTWIAKKANIDVIVDMALYSKEGNQLQTAMHLCNMLKVSAIESVRSHAGKALIRIFPTLSPHERNEVIVELTRALEMQDYQFTKYIPAYLGEIIMYLNPGELDELVRDFGDRIKTANQQITFLLLRTIGYCIVNYGTYRFQAFEPADKHQARLERMVGLLLNGLYNYDKYIRHEAFRIIGREVFGSERMTLEEKYKVFLLVNKKILNVISKITEDELVFLNDAASMNSIYRFISDYEFFKGNFEIPEKKEVAFFPGTFDPFSLSHKEIAIEIRNLGYEVYLAVDEFSWSKRTQPNLLRREIIEMSVSDEMDIYLFPEDIQVNIANPQDLKVLRDCFAGRRVYMVVGSDVVLNASSYKTELCENSVQTFDHIVFDRKKDMFYENEEEALAAALSNIRGEVVSLTLPPQYEDISSTKIRDCIDGNQDISQLIDPLAQEYIYKFGIYIKEPQYKTVLQVKSIDVQLVTEMNNWLTRALADKFFKHDPDARKTLLDITEQKDMRIVYIEDMISKEIIGFSIFHWVRSSMYFNHFQDNQICSYIRDHAIGRVAVISAICVDEQSRIRNLNQKMLTETLAYCLARDYTYAIFKNEFPSYDTTDVEEVMTLQGFLKVESQDGDHDIYIVNMTNPCTLNLDAQMMMKEPFRSNPQVEGVLLESRKRLQQALTALYPGQLVLSFDMDVLTEKMIDRICKTNDVPVEPRVPRRLGKNMCVPFGSILNNAIVPNTVTKSLHTEKMYDPDLLRFTIEAYPYYMNIINQVRLLSSFHRPVILIDDLLHKGYRIRNLDPLLKQEGIAVKKLIFGVMSGRGKEIMDIQNREVDAAYFLPNLRTWFNEKAMYPFVGGDSVWRGTKPKRYMLPSINFILPYTAPVFIKDADNADLFYLSQVCIENAIELFKTIEREYQLIYERNFTLRRLGEVFSEPRCPDPGKNIDYDLNLKPSEYLYDDLERLYRIKPIVGVGGDQ